MPETYDVAVVGLGALGSQATWRLAARGLKVLGLEQFWIGNNLGSTHGHTRLFRVACLEHPGLTATAQRSRDIWRELESESNEQLLRITGGLTIGPPEAHAVSGALEAAKANGLTLKTLTSTELRDQYPQHANVPNNHIGLFDPDAGIAKPERSVLAACAAAERRGARILPNNAVTQIVPENSKVTIHTNTDTFTATNVVVTAGPWLSKLVPAIDARPRRTPMMWFRPKADPAPFDIGRFPVFIRYINDDIGIWGHGDIFSHGIKIGLEDRGGQFADADPDGVERAISPSDWHVLSRVVSESFPALDPTPSRAISCMITNSPDGQFTLGPVDGHPNIFVGGACSGHGFKHSPALGELLAQNIAGETPFTDTAFMSPSRFAANSLTTPIGR